MRCHLTIFQEHDMEDGQPSATAILSAIHRASHLLLDETPTIFQDYWALRLSGVEHETALRDILGAAEAEIARRSTPEFAQTMLRYTRAFVTMRQRYTEDALAQALARGVGQYVILGAGLASFAYRRPDLAAVVRVFEVDHPATQQWKRTRLQELDVVLPSNLTFVPLDFEQHTLAEELRACGHQPELPTFFSWLGVTAYLTDEAVFETLRYVASLAPESEIVFEYWLAESLLSEEGRRVLAMVQAIAAARG